MARVVMQAVVSVDGYIAYPDDTVGPLFDWYFNGDTDVVRHGERLDIPGLAGHPPTTSSPSGTPSRSR